MKRIISKTKIVLIAVIAIIATNACVRKDLNDIPTVQFNVDWSNAKRATTGKQHNGFIVLYPQFSYNGGNITINVTDSEPAEAEILPGVYKVHMYNIPSDIIAASGGTFDSLSLEVLTDLSVIEPIEQIMSLGIESTYRSVTINSAADAMQTVNIVPVSFSKSLRFKITAEKFGTIQSLNANVTGIASKIRIVDAVLSKPRGVKFSEWTVDASTLTSKSVEVMGVYTDYEPVILTLNVVAEGVNGELVQSVDLTNELKNTKGDEIEVVMTVTYEPELKITGITINEWLNGNKIEVSID